MQLATERLILEPLEVAHAEKLYAGLSDVALYKFIPNDPLSLDELKEKYHRILRGPRDNNIELWRNWAVRLEVAGDLDSADDNEYIGMIETSVFPNDHAYLAYFMFASHHRQGYAHEACATVLRHVRETYSIKRVVAEMDVRNTASWRLAESLGFIRTGNKLNADFFKGESSDEYLYELTF
jgi:[ribosomal protein S5]-alanine N-acetyltransferase